MPSDVSFSFYFVTSSAEADAAAGGLFSPVPLRTPVHVCVYISASIILSYRCNQRRVSIKVFAWGLRGSTGRRLHSGRKRRHSLIHGRSMRQWGGVQILPLWYQRPHIPGFGNMECVYQHVFFSLCLCTLVCLTRRDSIRWTPSYWPCVCQGMAVLAAIVKPRQLILSKHTVAWKLAKSSTSLELARWTMSCLPHSLSSSSPLIHYTHFVLCTLS